ncbi:MAG TPA: hypothetical protein VEJ63_05055 [Planctomycetota bacterium]|nr:hypothetical protein [Planctomycetota bacterium]
MSEYLVLFRLPLKSGSPLERLLIRARWQPLSDSVYYRKMDARRDHVVAQVKALCSSVGQIAGRDGLSAFTVVCIDEHIKAARQRSERAREAALTN